MTEEIAADKEDAKQVPSVIMRVLSQSIRDMSFENVMAQKGISGEVQPEISVQVNLGTQKRKADHQYEVRLKLGLKAKAKDLGEDLFLFEIDYSGLFHVEGVPENQLHPFLMIECPRMLFPFVRRIVSDVTRDGGYPPVNLDNIDFVAMYRNELQRRQAEQAEKAEKEDA